MTSRSAILLYYHLYKVQPLYMIFVPLICQLGQTTFGLIFVNFLGDNKDLWWVTLEHNKADTSHQTRQCQDTQLEGKEEMTTVHESSSSYQTLHELEDRKGGSGVRIKHRAWGGKRVPVDNMFVLYLVEHARCKFGVLNHELLQRSWFRVVLQTSKGYDFTKGDWQSEGGAISSTQENQAMPYLGRINNVTLWQQFVFKVTVTYLGQRR